MSNNLGPQFFLPRIWEEISDYTNFYGWDFLKPLIGRKIFWASVDWYNYQTKKLPPGYAGYVIKTEGPNIEWIEQQTQHIDSPIFICCLYKDYGAFDHLPNVHFIPTIEWHYQLQGMSQVIDTQVNKNICYKISALCNRATQSKIIALAALAQHIGLENCLVSLNYIENKNIHNWELTNNATVDHYIHYFLENFKNTKIKFDEDTNRKFLLHDFHNKAYTDSAININNESFHYSYMVNNNLEKIYPGPFVTEKTLKCLLGETAFINNGQFDTYSTLSSLGFEFDYGIDLSYDQDPGNISRISGMINVIKQLADYTPIELYEQTRKSCLHNKNYIISGDFYHTAEAINQSAIESILNQL